MLDRVAIGNLASRALCFPEAKESAFATGEWRAALWVRANGEHACLFIWKLVVGKSGFYMNDRVLLPFQLFRFFAFKPLDRGLEPSDQRALEFFWRAGPIQGVYRFACLVQRDMPARDALRTRVRGEKFRENALAAWPVFLKGILIQAGRRVLKYELWTPFRARRVAIRSALDKGELRAQRV